MTDEERVNDFFKLVYSPLPSKNLIEYWLAYYTERKDYPSHTKNGGKWLIFCSDSEIDKTWEIIKKAQDDLYLGDSSKAATKLNSENYKGNYVICVYTYDSEDKEDVLRVRENLRKLGFEKPLHYKRDIETIKGIYGSENEFLITI